MTVSENGLPGVGFQTSSAEKEAAEYPGHREKGLAAWQYLTGCPRPAGVPKSWDKFQGLYDAVTKFLSNGCPAIFPFGFPCSRDSRGH